MTSRSATLLVVVLVACTPEIPDGRLACASDADCPSGFACRSMRCSRGAPGDGGLGLDGGDTPIDAEVPIDAPCTDPSSDPQNCGSCGNVCRFDHGVASCEEGSCVRTGCDEGWADCDADPDTCESDLTSIDACGACGTVCPTAPAHGVSSCTLPTPGCELACDTPYPLLRVGASAYCSPFGGMFQMTGGGSMCHQPNPLTGSCACPSGYAERSFGWGRTHSGLSSTLHVCEIDAATLPDTTWGGLYVDDVAAGGACVLPNRLTGDCTCTLGTVTSGEFTGSHTSTAHELRLVFCRAGTESAGWAPFAGAFTMTNGGTTGCGASPTCVSGSDGCTCPTGTMGVTFQTATYLSGTGCNGQSTLCYVP